MSQTLAWIALEQLKSQFMANVAAMEGAHPALAAELRDHRPTVRFFLSPRQDHVVLGRSPQGESAIEPLAHPVSPMVARQAAQRLFPKQQYDRPAAVFGLDQGWLWDLVYKLPIAANPLLPDHRPPLYLLCSDLERLWAVMHFQAWSAMLADHRVRLFVGKEAVGKLMAALMADSILPAPQISVTVDQSLWCAGDHFQAFAERVILQRSAKMDRLAQALEDIVPTDLRAAFAGSRPLRILGITSRFTTFLQHSMRDWLAAMEALGHQTRLLIEQADHQCLSSLCFGAAMSEFRPDLVLLLDHYRNEYRELSGRVPCVMWIQDRLGHLFSSKAGQAQGPLDFSTLR